MEGPGGFKGRGAVDNPVGRYERHRKEAFDDGWGSLDELPPAPKTELGVDRARSVITYNQSPDIPFDRSINPYRGCEHGCAYCYARPSHAYLGLSPGLDFETKLFYKADAVDRLRRELAQPRYRCQPIALGVNTDAYQPVERRLEITRGILELLLACRHPASMITKSGLMARDLDILAEMARRGLFHAAVSVTSLDDDIGRRLEPRAAGAARRLRLIEQLSLAGIPVTVMVAPLIPGLTDHELEAILDAARARGAVDAVYIPLRLPNEVEPLFEAWLQVHYPLKAEHVLNLIRNMHGGRAYRSEFGARMRGGGPLADLLAQRFQLAYRKLAFPGTQPLDCSQFRPPRDEQGQMSLF